MRALVLAGLLAAAAPAVAAPPADDLTSLRWLGSHNSYRPELDAAGLATLRRDLGERAAGLEYGHPAIARQLDLGLRQLEFDAWADSRGGLYVRAAAADQVMRAPGAKVLHIPVVDDRTQCLTLAQCFAAVASWSDAHPGHDLLVILVNVKEDETPVPGAPPPELFTPENLSDIDRSAVAAFGRGRLFTPDLLRGDLPTLRAAALARRWPGRTAMRGKVMLVLDSTPRVAGVYAQGHPALRGRTMFGFYDEAADEAAIFNIQDPKAEEDRIRRLVGQGFMVRTRSDADTREARAMDHSRLEAAVRSGAQIISTDYYPGAPDPLGLGFVVDLPDALR